MKAIGWLTTVCLVWLIPTLATAQFQRQVTLAERREMVRRIDELILQRIGEAGIEPGALAGDSEFLRRVSLDLTGLIPRVAEVRAFLQDESPDRREALIERLLASPRHATHLANSWRQFMLPAGLGLQEIQNVAGVQKWLRGQFAQNMRYDRVVSDFLVASGGGDAGPALYYTSLELKPEKLAASTSRIFLGLQMESAQCHPHPFDHWQQEDFWGYAAFFARLDQSQAMNAPGGQVRLVDLPTGEVTLPDSETVVAPKFLDGSPGAADQPGSRRVQLAIWMASRDNPYLARAAVNRVWAHLFGRGLVEPVDDLGPHNPPSHPRLLDELTDYFVATGFNLRELFRTLTWTDAYQRTSVQRGEAAAPPDLFAVMAVKTLTAEQLYDCLNQIVLRQPDENSARPLVAGGGFDPQRLAFAAKMNMRGVNASEFEAGILQALTLLNGPQTAAATSIEQSSLLAGLEAPWFTDQQRIEILCLATLARPPSQQEHEVFTAYVADAANRDEKQQAFGDILWALLNSAEFLMNH